MSCPVCGRRMCDCSPSMRGQTTGAMMEQYNLEGESLVRKAAAAKVAKKDAVDKIDHKWDDFEEQVEMLETGMVAAIKEGDLGAARKIAEKFMMEFCASKERLQKIINAASAEFAWKPQSSDSESIAGMKAAMRQGNANAALSISKDPMCNLTYKEIQSILDPWPLFIL